jgi:hypothetical protein
MLQKLNVASRTSQRDEENDAIRLFGPRRDRSRSDESKLVLGYVC